LAAHICNTDQLPNDARHEFQAWGGYSPYSGGPISSTADRHFSVGGFSYSRRCWSWSKVSVGYNLGFMPVAMIKQPAELIFIQTTPLPPPGFIGFFPVAGLGYTFPSRFVYGFAGTPAGFTLDFWRSARIYPFIQVDGGLVKSEEPVPVNVVGGTSLNFLLSAGGGIKLRVHKSLAFSTGYKLMHLSKAGQNLC
jgi:hypothetical protein